MSTFIVLFLVFAGIFAYLWLKVPGFRQFVKSFKGVSLSAGGVVTKEKLAQGKALLEAEKKKTAAINEQIKMREDWAKILTDTQEERKKQVEARAKLQAGKK